MQRDTEKDSFELTYVCGYPSLAAFIASDSDHSTAIYRRFDRLSARNLLQLQDELATLEKRQDEYDRLDLMTDDLAAKDNARNWAKLKARAADGGEEAQKRVDVAKEIREKIKEYREAILLETTILSLRRPSKQTYKAFNGVFHNVEDGEEAFPTLGGTSSTVYDDPADIMALARPVAEDRLTVFLRKHCPILFMVPLIGLSFPSMPRSLRSLIICKNRRGRPTTMRSSLAYISATRIALFLNLLSILLAAAFLFGAIYNLYYTKRDTVKLGLIAGYTAAFAICIGLVTEARRSEIFGACAAYAAVLVVFVSGNLKSP